MQLDETDWSLVGKTLLLISGLTYVRMAFYQGTEAPGWLMRVTLAIAGGFCLAVSARELRRLA